MVEGTRKYMLKVDEMVCRSCGRCMASEVCRGNAFIRMERDESPFLDNSRCWGCLVCMSACPFGAVVVHDHTD